MNKQDNSKTRKYHFFFKSSRIFAIVCVIVGSSTPSISLPNQWSVSGSWRQVADKMCRTLYRIRKHAIERDRAQSK